MKQTTFVLCNDMRQAESVLEVVIKVPLNIEAEISEICEDGKRWIKIYYETGADLLLLGIVLGRKTNLYNS